MNPPSPLLQQVVDRVVAAADPSRIVLFGSMARADTGSAGDIDLLVVKAGLTRRRPLAQAIYRALVGLPVPVDVIVVTPEDIETARSRPGSVVATALREGRDVYERA